MTKVAGEWTEPRRTMYSDPVPNQTLKTVTEPAVLSAVQRWYRTVVQVVVAFLAAWPIAVAAFHTAAATMGVRFGVMAGVMILVSAIHNALNARSAAATRAGPRP